MTGRLPAEPAPGPLEEYVARFDDLFGTLPQRQAFHRYLEGLLLPAERDARRWLRFIAELREYKWIG